MVKAKIKEKVKPQDMIDQLTNKDQYKEETSQIHAPADLIERTRQAVAEEEKRLQAEERPDDHRRHYDRVFRWTFSAAAAVILLFAVHRSAMLWGTGAGRASMDSGSDMAGAESYEEDGSINGADEGTAGEAEAAAGGAETTGSAVGGDSEKYATAKTEDCEIQQETPVIAENSMSVSEEEVDGADEERGVGDQIEELEKKYSEEDSAFRVSITEVDKKPDFCDRPDTKRVVRQGITFYVTQSTTAEEEADKTGAEKEEWSAYAEYNGKRYVITGQAADQDEFLEKACENLIFF